MNTCWRREILPVVALLAMLAFGWPKDVFGQQIIVEPQPRPPVMWGGQIAVDEHSVDVAIRGPIAHTHVTQVFRNTTGGIIEGTFIFPLPTDAAVGEFQMRIDGKVMEGQLLHKDEARQIYEAIVRQQRDPALLEYIDRGLFQTSVFPIPPGETRTVEFRYDQVVEAEDGLYRFAYPLQMPGARMPAERTSIDVDLQADSGLRVVYSPSHDISISRPDVNSASISYTSGSEIAESDFELFFGVSDQSIGVNVVSHRLSREDGYFLLLVAPKLDAAPQDVVHRDVVIVVDTSGSMEGPKMEQARAAVSYIVEHLNPGDRFNVIAFSTGVRLWESSLQQAMPDSIAAALDWIGGLEPSGSTDINRALLEALAQIKSPSDNKRGTGTILFMTDGLPTQGEIDPQRIVANVHNNLPDNTPVRLFAFGVGFDVDTDLLDTVSRDLGGRSSYVRPDEQIDEAVSVFYDTIRMPVLSNVAIDLGEDAVASDIYPYPLPDLFSGEQLVVTGRYRRGGETTVTILGEINGEQVRYVYPDQQLVSAGGEPFVARLWATRKVGALLDEIRQSGPKPELIDSIVDLSLRYGIVTPYTSYLVEEPELRLRNELGSQGFAVPTTGPPASEREQAVFPVPQSMRPMAEAAVADEASEIAAASSSGEEAVAASQERSKLMTATTTGGHQDVGYVAGKTFVNQGAVILPNGTEVASWVDTEFSDAMDLETIVFGSERYFELADEPTTAKMLALSPEMIIVVNPNKAWRITTKEEPEADTRKPAHDASDAPEESDFLHQLWDWFAGTD